MVRAAIFDTKKIFRIIGCWSFSTTPVLLMSVVSVAFTVVVIGCGVVAFVGGGGVVVGDGT